MGTTPPGQPNGASTTSVSSSGGLLPPGSFETEVDAESTETGGNGGSPADPLSDAPLWNSALAFLRPVLPPWIAEVLLSPLLVLEVVIRALLDSGSALLIPVAALGVFAGWACRRWAPKVAFSSSGGTVPSGFLAGWVPSDLADAPPPMTKKS